MNQHKTIIAPAAVVDQIRALAATWPGGVGMFQTELSADGLEPATHFISSGMIDTAIASALESAPVLVAMILAANPESTATENEIQAVIDACDVTDGEPWARLASLGLQIINKTEEGLA